MGLYLDFLMLQGLRQGCPMSLSLFLFLLVAEELSRLIIASKRNGCIRGIKVGQKMWKDKYVKLFLVVHIPGIKYLGFHLKPNNYKFTE